MTVSSSATPARCGNRSETHRPLWPRCWNSQSFLRSRPTWPKNTSGFSPPPSDLPCRLGQLRLVVERVDLAEAAAETDVDGPAGLGRMMRRRIAASPGVGAAAAGRSCASRLASATLPSPPPTHERKSRRASGCRQALIAWRCLASIRRCYSTYKNSLAFNSTRQSAGRPCLATNGSTLARSASLASGHRQADTRGEPGRSAPLPSSRSHSGGEVVGHPQHERIVE